VDLTPLIPAGRQIVESYGGGRFRVTGVAYQGSVLVFPGRTLSWPVAAMDQLDEQSLAPIVAEAAAGGIDLLLLGCGARMAMVPAGVRQHLRAAGVVAEAMDTGAACRTYNVLMADGRRVAAALIAFDS
jgi:uncharacterized protein